MTWQAIAAGAVLYLAGAGALASLIGTRLRYRRQWDDMERERDNDR